MGHRGDFHVFLGHPLSDAADKTCVEPGNVFSPGVATCGIRVCCGDTDPVNLSSNDVKWGFDDGQDPSPVLRAEYQVADGVTLVSRLAQIGSEHELALDCLHVELSSREPTDLELRLIVEGPGPAGGHPERVEWKPDAAEAGCLSVGDDVDVLPDSPPDLAKTESDGAALLYRVRLNAGETRTLGFRVAHRFAGRSFMESCPPPTRSAANARAGSATAEAEWRDSLVARIHCPDERVARAFYRCLYHILAAAERGLPRIGAVTYPVFWMRDCVIIMRAMDLAGRHDLVRRAAEWLAPVDFAGGFGAEADAPGQGIWALCGHARLTRDAEWLETIWPHVERRARLIEDMLHAEGPIRVVCDTRHAAARQSPGSNILCLAAQDGLIQGRMDWHIPTLFVNAWSLAGLTQAAWAARNADRPDAAEHFSALASDLQASLEAALPQLPANARDLVVSPHPTAALADVSAFAERFRRQFLSARLDEQGRRRPEPLWSYFEAAAAHNAMLLGMQKDAWTVLSGMLDDSAWDVAAFTEGRPGGYEADPFGDWSRINGGLDPERAPAGNMPHNWTAAEVLAAIRDMFVVEYADTLRLALGVPDEWLEPGAEFGVKNLPTDFGPVTYRAVVEDARRVRLHYDGPEPPGGIEFLSGRGFETVRA